MLDKFTQWREKILKDKYRAISPIKFGMTQEEIISMFGQPTDVSVEKKPLIFKYADIEFHFDKLNDYKLFLVYSDEEIELSILFEPLLSQKLTDISEQLENNNEIYCDLFSKGHNIIVEYKNDGGTQGNAYNTIYCLYLNNREKNDNLCEYREDLITDWLDCACGFMSPKLRIF